MLTKPVPQPRSHDDDDGKKSNRLLVSLTDEQLRLIEDESRRLGVSRADVARMAIMRYFRDKPDQP